MEKDSSRFYLIKQNMTAKQIEERKRLEKFMKVIVLEKVGFTSIAGRFCKTKYGYFIQRRCIGTCKTNWTIRLRVPCGNGVLYSNADCQHN